MNSETTFFTPNSNHYQMLKWFSHKSKEGPLCECNIKLHIIDSHTQTHTQCVCMHGYWWGLKGTVWEGTIGVGTVWVGSMSTGGPVSLWELGR